MAIGPFKFIHGEEEDVSYVMPDMGPYLGPPLPLVVFTMLFV
jgi:hypothetical protein